MVERKSLLVKPNRRSSHVKLTPTLGGVAFFASFIVSQIFIQDADETGIGIHFIVAITILFFMGLKDDLMVLTSRAKIILQSTAIFFILICQELWISNFHGFLGLYEMPFWVSIPLGYFIILYIINAYNLIDGIDGLAGMLGVLIAFTYAVIFYNSGQDLYFYISLVIIGYLMAFLRYNLSGDKKIFMGDTGSMITGFLLGLLTLRFLTLNTDQLTELHLIPANKFIISLSILFFPAIDVLRVVSMRLLNSRGAFTADRSHLHHIFIDKGLKHHIASKTIAVSSMLVFLLIYGLNLHFSYVALTFYFVIISVTTFYILLLLDKDPLTKVRRKKMKSYIPKWLYEIEFRIRKSIIVFFKKTIYKDLL